MALTFVFYNLGLGDELCYDVPEDLETIRIDGASQEVLGHLL